MMQYGRHITALTTPSAFMAASQYKDMKPIDMLPFAETPEDDMHPFDKAAMELSRKFEKLGV